MSQVASQETDFWDPTLFHHVWLGLFTMLSYKMSFHSCYTMWISRLGFIYGSRMTVLHHIFFFHLCIHKCVSRIKDRVSAPTAWSVCSPNLNSLNSYLWGYLKSTVYATTVNDVQDLATTNTEWISDYSNNTRNFPEGQSIIVQTCNIMCWS